MNESFKTDPSLATSARAAKESGSSLCASDVTPTAVRFIVSVFLCLLCFCRMSSTQMTCSHFRKNRPKKRQKPAGCRSRIISKNRPVPIFGRSTGASLHLNLALTGDGALLLSLKKTHSVWFISVLNYGDTENVLINHLLLVIPMSYPCHYTNLGPHKPHKHAHTHLRS